MDSFKGSYLIHQRTGIEWLCQKELHGAILADEPGMGKTVMTIGLMLERPTKTLIVSPKSVVHQWVSEIRRFCDIPVVAVTKASPRPALLNQTGPTVVVINYGAFQRNKEYIHWVFQELWGRVVCDEGHVMKNPKAQVFEGLSHLASRSRVVLTGTPIQNKERDLLTIAKWLGVQTDANDVRAICERCVLRRTMEDVPDFKLPELTLNVHHVEFTPEEKKMYDEVESYARDCAHHAMANGGAMEILEAILRCRQICSHPQLFIDGMRKKLSVELDGKFDEALLAKDWVILSSKMRAVRDLILEHVQEDKSVVFCTFVKEMFMCQEEMARCGIKTLTFYGAMDDDERADTLAQFREDPDVRVLFVQILAGGTGLNLQSANRVYVMSPQYNPTWEIQAKGRCFRHGQQKPVYFTRLVMQDSIEGNIIEVSERKLALISSALGDPRISSELTTTAARGLTRKDVRTIFRRNKKQKVAT